VRKDQHAADERLPDRVDESGFTLIELLIVVVILGVLAGFVVFAVDGTTKASAVTACQADYKTVETAAGAYESQTGNIPSSVGALVGSWLRGPLANTNDYVIGIDTHTGDITVQSVNPFHSAQRGSANCAYA
jgi:prepilin-type N-terminal cleavage/methylation domain-containing protein